MRLTKIVCTLGPASNTPDMILDLMKSGMNVARINFSHGDQQTHGVTIQAVKDVREQHGYDTALLLDTKGPEIRTGDVSAPIPVKRGEEVLFTYDKSATYEGTIIHVNYPDFGSDVVQAEAILVDNGELTFSFVRSNDDGSVILRADQDGLIGNRRHVNLPGAHVSLPSITEQDWSDIAFGAEQAMDIVALSFVRTADEVKEVRAFLKKKKSPMRVWTKVETRQAVEHIDAIIDASDGIMIARGDLGAEIPFQKIPEIQDAIVDACRRAHKPVLVATQMLESMIKNPMPTRAEVTDVAHAAMTRADGTMLSGETAAGKFPLRAAQAMSLILETTEQRLSSGDDGIAPPHEAVTLGDAHHASAIVLVHANEEETLALSRARPSMPIVAFAASADLRRHVQPFFGIHTLPLLQTQDEDDACAALVERGLVPQGATIVLMSGDGTPSIRTL